MELINRESLLEKFQFRIDPHGVQGATIKECVEIARKIILDEPEVDAVEVVHGQWELYPSHMHRRCSVCKVEYDKPKFNIRANYCPNCGAKMDGDWNG